MPSFWSGSVAALCAALSCIVAAVSVIKGSSKLETAQVVHQFPSGTWVENISVRANGNLVVVLYDRLEVYELNPFDKRSEPKLLNRFNNTKSITGCVETTPDVFAVMVNGNESFSIWTIGLSSTQPVSTKVVSDVVGAKSLNGLTSVSPTTLLASDTIKGVVYKLDLATGSSSVVIEEGIGIGVNGLPMRDGYLYFINSRGTLSQIPINSSTAAPTGEAKVIANPAFGIDDFALSPEGDVAYVMSWLRGQVLRVEFSGNVTVIGEASWPTSAQFGRTKSDATTLYATTSGNPLASLFSAIFEGGGVMSLSLQL